MTAEELKRIHADYRKAVEAYRDEQLPQEARDKASADVIELRRQIDDEMLNDKQYREDQDRLAAIEARDWAAKVRGLATPTEQKVISRDAMKDFIEGRSNQVIFKAPLEQRTTTVLTSTDTTAYGSYTVPQTWASEVAKFAVAQSGVLAAGPKILQTADGAQINMPILSTDMTSTAGTEGAAATNSTYPVFGTVPFNSYRIEGFVPLADELIRDSGVDLEAEVRELAARSLGAKMAAYLGDIDVGTGSSAPAAITVGVTSAVTAASQTAVTLDEQKQLMYSVLPEYRAMGRWIGNSTITLSNALAKDDNGSYIWQPSNMAAEPDMFFGKPWYEDAYFDASTTGNIPVVFGDVNRAYTVRYVGGIEVSFSRDFLFTNFAVTCRFARWFDAATMDTIAVKAVTLA